MNFLKKYFLFSLLLLCTTRADQPPSPLLQSAANAQQKVTRSQKPDVQEATTGTNAHEIEPIASPVELEKDSSKLTPPWMKPRELSRFQTLLQHSPFSLATAEDVSPLSERYMLTGVISLDGEEQVFVMDRNDQSRELVTKKPNAKGMVLVNIIHDDDPNKLRATIRVNGETGVINNIDLSENSKTGRPGAPMSPYAKGGSHLPATPRYPGNYPGPGRMMPPPQNQGYPSNYNNRRIIHRPPISAPSGGQNYQPPTGAYPGTAGSYPSNNYQPGTSGRPPSNYPSRVPPNSYESSVPSY